MSRCCCRAGLTRRCWGDCCTTGPRTRSPERSAWSRTPRPPSCPYDVQSRIEQAYPDRIEQRVARELEHFGTWVTRDDDTEMEAFEHPDRPGSVITVAGLIPGHRATFEGRVNQVEDITRGKRTLRVDRRRRPQRRDRHRFRPGHGGADIQPGQLLRIIGKPKQTGNRPLSMLDPAYHIVEDPAKAGRPEKAAEAND